MLTHKKRFRTVDEYIKTFPKDIQSILERMRQAIPKAAPEAVEAISYQMPTFKLNGRLLVSFAACNIISASIRYPQALELLKRNYRRIKEQRARYDSR